MGIDLGSITGIAYCSNSYYHLDMQGLSIKLPDDLRRRVAREAMRRNVTQSTIVRECIERGLEDGAPRRPPATCAELVRDLVGSVSSGRSDLGTNKALLEEAILRDNDRTAKRRC